MTPNQTAYDHLRDAAKWGHLMLAALAAAREVGRNETELARSRGDANAEYVHRMEVRAANEAESRIVEAMPFLPAMEPRS